MVLNARERRLRRAGKWLAVTVVVFVLAAPSTAFAAGGKGGVKDLKVSIEAL